MQRDSIKQNKSLFKELETLNSPKFYKQAPLPFMGQKKNFLELFRKALLQKEIDSDLIFLDVFGGSGLLSNTIKYYYPNNEVVWNDYDNYQHRLDCIEITNEIKMELESSFDFKNMQDKIPQEIKEQILNIFLKYIHKYGEDKIDFITFSAYFLFYGNYAKDLKSFAKMSFYNRYAFNTLQKELYLQGVKRECLNFKELLEKYKEKKPLLILDPPYLQTQVGNYRNSMLLKDFLHLIKYIQDKEFILFASTKSDNEDMLDFVGITYKRYITNLNIGKDKDLLLYRFYSISRT